MGSVLPEWGRIKQVITMVLVSKMHDQYSTQLRTFGSHVQ